MTAAHTSHLLPRTSFNQARPTRLRIIPLSPTGKSTLLNSLCGSTEVYADDLLFATLDPTTRMLALPGGKEVLISDTVGFIQKLPTKLIAAFRATLDELVDATLVVHVVDASSELAVPQVRAFSVEPLEAHSFRCARAFVIYAFRELPPSCVVVSSRSVRCRALLRT